MKKSAEQERKTILERQRQGIQLAKEKDIYKGGIIKYSEDSKDPKRRLIYHTVVEMLKRKENGEPITITEIADKVGITRNTVYRIKKEIMNIKNKNNQ